MKGRVTEDPRATLSRHPFRGGYTYRELGSVEPLRVFGRLPLVGGAGSRTRLRATDPHDIQGIERLSRRGIEQSLRGDFGSMNRLGFSVALLLSQLPAAGCSWRDLMGKEMLVGVWIGTIGATGESVRLSFFAGGSGEGTSSVNGSFDFAWERSGDDVRLTVERPHGGPLLYVGAMLEDGGLVFRLVNELHNQAIVLKRVRSGPTIGIGIY
jgi:hypothetical protein